MLVVLVAGGCEGDAESRPVPVPPASRAEQERAVATAGLRIGLEVAAMRPLSAALGESSYTHEGLDEIDAELTDAATWLGHAIETGDEVELGAASLMVHFAGVHKDLVRVDLEATARGLAGTVRTACNTGVRAIRQGVLRLRENHRWPIEDPGEVAAFLGIAVRLRDRVLADVPVANAIRPGVIAASTASGALSLITLTRTAPALLGRLAAWLKGTGQPAAGLRLVAAGNGVAMEAFTVTSSIALTGAEIEALVAVGTLSAAVAALYGMARGQFHHICTNKNWISAKRGGPWTPLCEQLFQKAGINLEHPANRIWVEGHIGPHPQAYHAEVFRRLQEATASFEANTPGFREALIKALVRIGQEIRTPGTELNLLVTRGTP